MSVRVSSSSQTCSHISNKNIGASTTVTRSLKICVSFADKYTYTLVQKKKRNVFICIFSGKIINCQNQIISEV